MTSHRGILIILFVVFLTACGDTGDKNSPSGAQSVEELAEKYISAINTRDKQAQKSLIHPRCLADLTDIQDLFIQETLERDFRHTVPDEREVKIDELAGDGLPFSEMVIWPIAPTHQLMIQFSTGDHSSTTLVRFLTYENGKWFINQPMLNDTNLQQYREHREGLKSHQSKENNPR